MGLSLRFFIAEDDGTVTRVPTARYDRWFQDRECLPPDRAGQELHLLEVVARVDRQRVLSVLRILPVRERVGKDGRLDSGLMMRLAFKRIEIIERVRCGEPGAAIEQLEIDANYFWAPTDRQLAELGAVLFKRPPTSDELGALCAALSTPGQALEPR
jgi:hypothetical protein